MSSGYRTTQRQSNAHNTMPTPLHISCACIICAVPHHSTDPNSPIRWLSKSCELDLRSNSRYLKQL
jgi:hypothetical protein